MCLVDIRAERDHVQISVSFGDDATFESSVAGTDFDFVSEQISVKRSHEF